MSDEVYFVEKILGHKTQRGKKYFLIKWIGYPDSDNSWEPQENIHINLIRAYEEDFSSENVASLANSTHIAKKPKTKSIKQKKIKLSAKTSVEEIEKTYNLTCMKETKLSDSETDEESNVKASCSTDEDKDANICQMKTQEAPKPKDRVEKILGYSNLNEHNGKTHLIVKFASESNNRVVPHDEFRYQYPQELIDFYESSIKWFDRKIENFF